MLRIEINASTFLELRKKVEDLYRDVCDFSKIEVPVLAQTEEVKEVEKPKKSKASKAVAETVAQAVEPQQEVPPVIEPEVTFDRDSAIQEATKTIQALSAKLEGQNIAAMLKEIYLETGCPLGVKIGELSEEQLKDFMPLFLKKASQVLEASSVDRKQMGFI